ncbi:hypothetical protein [Acidisphaera sp. L21]|jgi:hypothetical protein|uniref:hypothetical protein n=1 Tax=Acidisphaera sp. L21 TaxID=1641851 RepID=UPI00131CBD22|nr:hypothetical protein [Acidisphaera sp. L21]
MSIYETVKVFDLSSAPPDLREADDLAILRPDAEADDSTILSLKVGCFATPRDRIVKKPLTREVTYTEFQLHRWLVEHGAQEGEDIFLRWSADDQLV